MAPKQRMRLASQKHSQNVTNRGNVPKSVAVSPTIVSCCKVCDTVWWGGGGNHEVVNRLCNDQRVRFPSTHTKHFTNPPPPPSPFNPVLFAAYRKLMMSEVQLVPTCSLSSSLLFVAQVRLPHTGRRVLPGKILTSCSW